MLKLSIGHFQTAVIVISFPLFIFLLFLGDIQQKQNLRRKSSDDDSPDGPRTHTRGRGRKNLRRGKQTLISI